MNFSSRGCGTCFRFVSFGAVFWVLLSTTTSAAQERMILKGFDRRPTSVGFSNDGQMVATSAKREIWVWDAKTGEKITVLEHKVGVGCVAFSPTSKHLAASTEVIQDNNSSWVIQLYDTTTWKVERSLEGGGPVIQFATDGKLLASTSQGAGKPLVVLWDPATGKKLAELKGQEEAITALVLTPDGKVLAAGGIKGTVVFWDVATHKQIHNWAAFTSELATLAFSPDGKTLAAGGDMSIGAAKPDTLHSVKFWDVAAEKEAGGLPRSGLSPAVQYSPDGRLLAVGRRRLSFYDRKGDLWVEHKVRDGHAIHAMAFSPDGKTVATVLMEDMSISLWDVPDKKPKTPPKKKD